MYVFGSVAYASNDIEVVGFCDNDTEIVGFCETVTSKSWQRVGGWVMPSVVHNRLTHWEVPGSWEMIGHPPASPPLSSWEYY